MLMRSYLDETVVCESEEASRALGSEHHKMGLIGNPVFPKLTLKSSEGTFYPRAYCSTPPLRSLASL